MPDPGSLNVLHGLVNPARSDLLDPHSAIRRHGHGAVGFRLMENASFQGCEVRVILSGRRHDR
jgi:hypothetical protein